MLREDLMSYSLFVEKKLDKRLQKLAKKNPELIKALDNKLQGVLQDPYRFKPLNAPMQGIRRIHVFKSFVACYEIIENKKQVKLLEVEHHDNAYV